MSRRRSKRQKNKRKVNYLVENNSSDAADSASDEKNMSDAIEKEKTKDTSQHLYIQAEDLFDLTAEQISKIYKQITKRTMGRSRNAKFMNDEIAKLSKKKFLKVDKRVLNSNFKFSRKKYPNLPRSKQAYLFLLRMKDAKFFKENLIEKAKLKTFAATTHRYLDERELRNRGEFKSEKELRQEELARMDAPGRAGGRIRLLPLPAQDEQKKRKKSVKKAKKTTKKVSPGVSLSAMDGLDMDKDEDDIPFFDDNELTLSENSSDASDLETEDVNPRKYLVRYIPHTLDAILVELRAKKSGQAKTDILERIKKEKRYRETFEFLPLTGRQLLMYPRMQYMWTKYMRPQLEEEMKKKDGVISSRLLRNHTKNEWTGTWPFDFRSIPEEVLFYKSKTNSINRVLQIMAVSQQRQHNVKNSMRGDKFKPLNPLTLRNTIMELLRIWQVSHEARGKTGIGSTTPQAGKVRYSWIVAAINEATAGYNLINHKYRNFSYREIRALFKHVTRSGRSVGDLFMEVLLIFSTIFHLRQGQTSLSTVKTYHISLDEKQGIYSYRPSGTKELKGGINDSTLILQITRASFPRQYASLVMYHHLRMRFQKRQYKKFYFLQPDKNIYEIPLQTIFTRNEKIVNIETGMVELSGVAAGFLQKQVTRRWSSDWLVAYLQQVKEIDLDEGGIFKNRSIRGFVADAEQALGLNPWGQKTNQSSYTAQQTTFANFVFANYPSYKKELKALPIGQIRLNKDKNKQIDRLMLSQHFSVQKQNKTLCCCFFRDAYLSIDNKNLAKLKIDPKSRFANFGNNRHCFTQCGIDN